MLIPMYCAHMYTAIITMNICVKVIFPTVIRREPMESSTIRYTEGKKRERPCPMAERSVLLSVRRSASAMRVRSSANKVDWRL